MRVLYGIDGEGMGHALRGKVVIKELQKNHKVKIVAGGRAYHLLKKHSNCSKLGFLSMVYRNNSIEYTLTFIYNILKLPFIFLYNLKLIWIFLKFNPQIVITDLEPFTCYFAMFFGKKCISIDNQHIINTDLHVEYDLIERLIIRLMTIKSAHYLVTTFFYPRIIRKNTYLFAPINRKEIIKAKAKEGDYILVYQTSKSDRKLISVLRSIDSKFIVYGFNKNKELGNVTLKKFNEESFIQDIANCKAVICNGGFTTIGEALHLGKPVLSIPVKKQLEQIRNATYLDMLGYGKYVRKANKKEIEEFILNIKEYKKNLKKYKKEDNSSFFKKLKEILK